MAGGEHALDAVVARRPADAEAWCDCAGSRVLGPLLDDVSHRFDRFTGCVRDGRVNRLGDDARDEFTDRRVVALNRRDQPPTIVEFPLCAVKGRVGPD